MRPLHVMLRRALPRRAWLAWCAWRYRHDARLAQLAAEQETHDASHADPHLSRRTCRLCENECREDERDMVYPF